MDERLFLAGHKPWPKSKDDEDGLDFFLIIPRPKELKPKSCDWDSS